ncbi:THUMP-like domain-containing protein [Flavobacterium pallidum]|uniref:SAM-dependent methyltransferase n=1 Tax=Flavobacterium pallidum TaxID=2172098 RepID=A0A2S1SJ09_9FLAO|nr:SAM-dependent methyltransferase [Flavobacterium pallidum]AWI26414.1 SAM-dependent methyltransferase [Flavobacterium pallidum]
MENPILKPEIQEFINSQIGKDVKALALKRNPFPDGEWIEILNQISAKTKAQTKLPTWFNTANIIYPSKISVEQTSSEKTAEYKSRLVSGENLIDLTGGFGVDDFYFSKKIKKVFHCEIDGGLSKIVSHNFAAMQAGNITSIHGDSTQVVTDSTIQYDWIYIDPSRRNEVKGKVFMLKDCSPNVPGLLDLYFSKSGNILIKTAPLLDITAGISELRNIRRIHIVAMDNEVRELLWELSADYKGQIEICTVNLTRNGEQHFDFIPDNNWNAAIGFPQKYLYEPNSAIMKSGGFEAVAERFDLMKLHKHSHLYTSDDMKPFPGRIFEIIENIAYEKGAMNDKIKGRHCNISVRNFPETPEIIRKKWKIKDGGDTYCFFTTDADNRKIVLICAKITPQ